MLTYISQLFIAIVKHLWQAAHEDFVYLINRFVSSRTWYLHGPSSMQGPYDCITLWCMVVMEIVQEQVISQVTIITFQRYSSLTEDKSQEREQPSDHTIAPEIRVSFQELSSHEAPPLKDNMSSNVAVVRTKPPTHVYMGRSQPCPHYSRVFQHRNLEIESRETGCDE